MKKLSSLLIRLIFASWLVLFVVSIAVSQSTTELPIVKLFNKRGESVLTSNISAFGRPILLFTYSQKDCSICIKLIDSLNLKYTANASNSTPQLIAINQDNQLTETEVFNFASRWKNVEVLFDKNEEFSKALYVNKYPILFFIDGYHQIIFEHNLNDISVSTISKIIDGIAKREIKANKVYYDVNNYPCLPAEATYYRLLKRDAVKGWIMESYYLNDHIKSRAEAIIPFPPILNGRWSTYKNTSWNDDVFSLESEGWYDYNKLDGEYKSYYGYKQVKEQINYYKGNAVGKYLKYFDNGKYSIEGLYSSEGIPNGEWKYYYKDGTLARKVFFNEDGFPDGECSNWYPSGKLYYSLNFKDGSIVYSSLKAFKENGNKYIEYIAGPTPKKYSLFVYDDKGNVQIKIEFSDENVLVTGYYPSGTILAKYSFILDGASLSADGKFVEWYENAQLKFELNFKNDKPVGKAISWHENGSVSQTANFDTKEMIYFDESGKKILKPFSKSSTLDMELITEHINSVIGFITQFYGQFDKDGNIEAPWY
jgi:antitoxin component YwqK of YwqJK toxin-antitoxin module